MLTLVLPLLLASVPCADLEANVRLIEETAHSRPSELAVIIEGIESRSGGLPLRPAGEVPAEQLARDVVTRLRAACELQEAAARPPASAPTSAPDRLRAILDRPEFSQARKRNTDLLQRLLRQIDAWLSGFFQSRGAQSFAVVTRAVMLGLALAVGLWGLLWFRR
ncbi:MAG: hypothetical protein ACJ8AT_34130, partial [Hyalangium sp.]